MRSRLDSGLTKVERPRAVRSRLDSGLTKIERPRPVRSRLDSGLTKVERAFARRLFSRQVARIGCPWVGVNTFVLGLKSSVLLLAASAIVGCFAPGDDEPTRSDTAGSGPDSSSSAESTSSPGTSPESTDDESTSASTSGESSATSSSSSTDTDATTTGEVVECGDGIVDEGEECDDGNEEDADACSNACVAGFYTGTLDPCSAYGETLCSYFEAECRRDPDGGELAQLCYWPQGSPEDACGDTSGIWTTPDSAFAVNSGFDFPLDGACITQLGNLDCNAADTQTCAEAGGALCFHEVGPVGEQLDIAPLCWWAVDEAGCTETPGIWTTADSGFGQGHPKALPPSGAPTCILQVPFI